MRSLKQLFVALLLAGTLPLFPSLLAAQISEGNHVSRDRRHDDPNWLSVEKHLPDPAIASSKQLEEQADLLRVRRFPEDALEYSSYAIKRGGNTSTLLNKIGLVELELRNIVIAQGYFRQAVKLDRTNPQGWNNLAATEYIEHEYSASVSDYKHAVKLDKTIAVFHANLSTAYFETRGYKKARREADEALRLDPLVFEHASGSGIAAHVLSVEDRARFCFEMAKLYAQHGNEPEMLHQLAKASESGFDITAVMAKDRDLARYVNDPRVVTLIAETRMLRPAERSSTTTTATVNPRMAPLPSVQPVQAVQR